MPPKRTRQHEIDSRAKGLLATALAKIGSFNEHKEDYHIDGTGELFTGEPDSTATGIDYQVQLKGCQRLKRPSQLVVCKLETRVLEHYLDNKRIPVFLFMVDVGSGIGYFIFLQQYAAEGASREWRRKKTISVRIPITNRMDNTDLLTKSIRDADAYMTQFRPGSLMPSIRAQQARMESLDPRFSIDIHASTTDGQVAHLRAKQNLELKLAVSGPTPSVQEFLEILIDHGEPVNPDEFGVEISFDGSPLFDNEGPVGQIQLCRHLGGSLICSVSTLDSRGFELTGEWTIGNRRMRLEAALPSGLVSAVCKTDGPVCNSLPFTFSYRIDLSKWIGKNVRYLPDYSRVARSFDETDSILKHVELFVDGNSLADAEVPPDLHSWSRRLAAFVWIAKRLRFLSGKTEADFVLQSSYSSKDQTDIEIAYDLLLHGRAFVNIDGGEFTTTVENHNISKGDTLEGRFVLRQESAKLIVCGQLVYDGYLDLVIDHGRINAKNVTSIAQNAKRIDWKFETIKSACFAFVTDPSVPPFSLPAE